MRKSINVVGRGVSVAAVVLFLTIPASAATEQKQAPHPKFKPPAVEKTVKKIIKAFGDWMSVPHP